MTATNSDEARAEQLRQARRRAYASLQRLLGRSDLTSQQKAELQRRFQEQDNRYKRLQEGEGNDADTLSDHAQPQLTTGAEKNFNHESSTPLVAGFYASVAVSSLSKAQQSLAEALALLDADDVVPENALNELRDQYDKLELRLAAFEEAPSGQPTASVAQALLFDCRLLAYDCHVFSRRVNLEAKKYQMQKTFEAQIAIVLWSAKQRSVEETFTETV